MYRNHPLDSGFAIYLRTSDAEVQAPERSQAGQRWVIEERILAASDLPIIEIYAELHAQGFRLRNGRPFVKVQPNGTRITAKTTISAIFRNWFYAG